VISLSIGGSTMVTISGRGFLGPSLPSGSHPFMLGEGVLSVNVSGEKTGEENVHLNFDSEDALAQENVSDCLVYEIAGGLAGVDHEAVGEFH
jgi:hypothetical protein